MPVCMLEIQRTHLAKKLEGSKQAGPRIQPQFVGKDQEALWRGAGVSPCGKAGVRGPQRRTAAKGTPSSRIKLASSG